LFVACTAGPVQAETPATPHNLFSVPEPVRSVAADTGQGPLRLTVAEAVLLCLQNNRSFAVQRYQPALTRTFEEEQRAVFDPVLSGSASRQWEGQPGGASAASTDLSVAAAERLPTNKSKGSKN